MNSKPIVGAEEQPGRPFSGYANSSNHTVRESAFPTTAISKLRAKRSNRDCAGGSKVGKLFFRGLIRAVYRFRDAALVAEKKDDFGNALQNLYRELERAEEVVVPAS
jgi:hypothetical protein